MKVKRLNWYVVSLLGAVVLFALARFPEGMVSEVHNASSAANFALVDPHPHRDDWPSYRGQDGRNVAASGLIPTEWSSSSVETWQVPLKGTGHSTPILWGEQLFLTSADPVGQRITLRSFHRETGRPLWQTILHQGDLPKILEKGTNASSTPACDGQSVFTATVARGSLWMTAVDFSGHIVWQREAGRYQARWGYGSSPVLYKNMVILAADQDAGGYLTAFHRQTGSIVWRIRRSPGESHGVPVVAMICGKPQLVLAGQRAVTSYDPATGNEIWRCHWSADRVANMVAFDTEHIYATNKHSDGEVICIKGDGTGDVSRTRLVWRQTKFGSEAPSPVLQGDFLYVLSDEGLITCLQASTGRIEWKKRLDGVFSASPIIAGDQLICCSESGSTTVLSTGNTGDVVAVNPLTEGIVASPIVVGSSIYIRTLSSLRCIGTSTSEPVANRPDSPRRRL